MQGVILPVLRHWDLVKPSQVSPVALPRGGQVKRSDDAFTRYKISMQKGQ